jgi:hypothetical protein
MIRPGPHQAYLGSEELSGWGHFYVPEKTVCTGREHGEQPVDGDCILRDDAGNYADLESGALPIAICSETRTIRYGITASFTVTVLFPREISRQHRFRVIESCLNNRQEENLLHEAGSRSDGRSVIPR